MQHELSSKLEDVQAHRQQLEAELASRRAMLEDASMTEQQLREHVQQLSKRHDPAVMMKRTLARMMRATMASSFETWIAHVAERKANRGVMKRVVAMYSANSLLFAFEAWHLHHQDVKEKQAEVAAAEERRLRHEEELRQEEEEARRMEEELRQLQEAEEQKRMQEEEEHKRMQEEEEEQKRMQEERDKGSGGDERQELEARYGAAEADHHGRGRGGGSDAGPAGVRAQVQEELLQETRLELDLLRSSV